MEQVDNVVERCITKSGGLSAFARIMEVDRQVVHSWRKKGYIPPRYAFEVQRVMDGLVTAEQVIKEADDILPKPFKVIRVEKAKED